MALSKSMAKDPLRYVVKNVLAIDDVHTVMLALGQSGVADIYELVFLGAESLDNLTLRDSENPDNIVRVKLGYRNRIRAFQSFIAHLEATGTPLMNIEWLTLSNDQYESYRTLLYSSCYVLEYDRFGPDRSTLLRSLFVTAQHSSETIASSGIEIESPLCADALTHTPVAKPSHGESVPVTMMKKGSTTCDVKGNVILLPPRVSETVEDFRGIDIHVNTIPSVLVTNKSLRVLTDQIDVTVDIDKYACMRERICTSNEFSAYVPISSDAPDTSVEADDDPKCVDDYELTEKVCISDVFIRYMPNRNFATFDGEVCDPTYTPVHSDWCELFASDVRKCSLHVPHCLNDISFLFDRRRNSFVHNSKDHVDCRVLWDIVDFDKYNPIETHKRIVCEFSNSERNVALIVRTEFDFVSDREYGEIRDLSLIVCVDTDMNIPSAPQRDDALHVVCHMNDRTHEYCAPDNFVSYETEIPFPDRDTEFPMGENVTDGAKFSHTTTLHTRLRQNAGTSTMQWYANTLTRSMAYVLKLRSFCTVPRYKTILNTERKDPDVVLEFLRGIPVRGKFLSECDYQEQHRSLIVTLRVYHLRTNPTSLTVRHLGRIIGDQMLGFSFKDWEDPHVYFLRLSTAIHQMPIQNVFSRHHDVRRDGDVSPRFVQMGSDRK